MRTILAKRRQVAALLGALTIIAIGACAKHDSRDGPYADSKQSWDAPHSANLQNSLRNRLATTQRDN